MAGGFLGLEASLGFPGEEGREKYAREIPGWQPNPIFERLLGQHLNQLDPRLQRQRLRRQMSGVSDRLIQGRQGSMAQLNEALASRGLGNSGIGAAATGDLLQGEAQERAQLPGLFHAAFQQRQQQAQQDALEFLLNIIQSRLGVRGMSESIAARKSARPTGFQQVLGDISGISDVLGGLVDIGGSLFHPGGAGGIGKGLFA